MGLLEASYHRTERAIRFGHAVCWAAAQAVGLGLLEPTELVKLTLERFENSSYFDPSYNETAGL